MKGKMKLLMACSEKTKVDRITGDLKKAGLPERVECVILSVADVFLPPRPKAGFSSVPKPIAAELRRKYARALQELKKAEQSAKAAGKIVASQFPKWKVRTEAVADSPAWGIVNKAAKLKIDLIVVGSRHWTALAEWFLGSVAQKVLAEARCSVRVIHQAESDSSPVRIVIGFDGSRGAKKAIAAVASRKWKKDTAVHIITAVDPRIDTDVKSARSWMEYGDDKHRWVHRMKESSIKPLRTAGLIVSSLIKEGDPKHVLAEEAKRWGADCVFVGARGLSEIERFLLGGVSMAVANRAHCTVEVVR